MNNYGNGSVYTENQNIRLPKEFRTNLAIPAIGSVSGMVSGCQAWVLGTLGTSAVPMYGDWYARNMYMESRISTAFTGAPMDIPPNLDSRTFALMEGREL